jgi:hypothetical protein
MPDLPVIQIPESSPTSLYPMKVRYRFSQQNKQ